MMKSCTCKVTGKGGRGRWSAGLFGLLSCLVCWASFGLLGYFGLRLVLVCGSVRSAGAGVVCLAGVVCWLV